MLEVFNQGHGSDSWGEGEVVTHTQRLNEIAGRVERSKNNPLGLTYEYQDITWLLEEVRVLREALELFACENVSTVNKGRCCIAREALLQLEGQEGRGMTHEDTVCDNATDGKEATE